MWPAFLVAVLVAGSHSAAAQTSTTVSLIAQAPDAFGEQIGNEQIGLYDESEVRGFSLQSAGNYRIDGHYFVQDAQLSDAVLASSTVQVGTSALHTDFPSPGGVVAFHLRRPPQGHAGLVADFGLQSYESPYLQLNPWWRSRDRSWSVVGGLVLQPASHYWDGTRGSDYSLGLVARRTFGRLRLTALADGQRVHRIDAYGFVSRTHTRPPPLRGPRLYEPSWADHRQKSYNAGVSADWTNSTQDWRLRASLYRSYQQQPDNGFTLLRVDSQLMAHAFFSQSLGQFSRATSGALSASRRYGGDGVEHRIYLTARYLRSDSLSTSGQTFDLGMVDLTAARYPAAPAGAAAGDPAPHWRTHIAETTAGVGDEVRLWDRLTLRGGVRHVWYDKSVAAEAPLSRTLARPWLYDAALILALRPDWQVYSTYTRGLQETGTAPNSAVNRNEVLPLVQARQLEAGARGHIAGLTLIATWFQIEKPTTGFDAQGRFGLVGTLSHTGVEFSLSGAPMPRLSLFAGAVAFRSQLTPAPDSLARVAVGDQPLTAQAGAHYALAALPGLSVDGDITYDGPRAATQGDEFDTPGHVTLDLGLRYRRRIGHISIALRARVQNVTNTGGWTAQPNGLLNFQNARTFVLTGEVALAD